MSDILAHARRFVGQYHFSVIPLDHPDDPIANDPDQRGKVPAIAWAAFQQTRPTEDVLTRWFGNGRKRNIGIVCGAISGIVFVDTDTPEAEAWADAHLPATPIQTLTAKGAHRGYRHPGTPVPTKARIRDGIDVRGDGGYVVAPSSLHASGHVYRAATPWPETLDSVPMFDLAWLGLDAPSHGHTWTASASVHEPRPMPDRDRVLARARRYLEHTPGAIAGQRGDEHTYQVCCRIVRGFQLDPNDARTLLRAWNARCVPPWSDRDLDAKIDSALRYGKEPLGARATDQTFTHTARSAEANESHLKVTKAFAFTDTGNAEAFATWHGDQVRFDHRRRRWLMWSGTRWMPDADAAVDRLAKETIRRRQVDALAEIDPDKRKAALKFALASESRQRRDAMLMLARSERPIADRGDSWDRDPWLLGVPNGVVDLRTSMLRPGAPDDHITMAAAVSFEPAAPCPRWEQALHEIFSGDLELVAHMQRAFGYALSGITTEQCAWVPHGAGANGKTTLLNTFRHCVGDYGYQMPFSTVLGGRKDVATNDLAALDGRRFVLASEVNDGARFDEARIKALTGCDPITARFLYAEFFEFVPVAKFWLATNHKPIVRDDSHSFWRRIRLVPFLRTFPVTPGLAESLKAEAPGILAWAVRGCLLWQAEGLGIPEAVIAATASYQRDSDVLGDFLVEACELDPQAETTFADLFRIYVLWAERRALSDRERLSQTMFGRKMGERFEKLRDRATGVIYRGIARRIDWP